MDDAETTASNLLIALAGVSRLLDFRAAALRKEPGWSEVTSEFSIEGPRRDSDSDLDDLPDEIRELRKRGGDSVMSGYVDATPDGHHGAAWVFTVYDERDSGWSLRRDVTLYPLHDDDIVHHLPELTFPNWHEFAESFPALIQELLDTPLPRLVE